MAAWLRSVAGLVPLFGFAAGDGANGTLSFSPCKAGVWEPVCSGRGVCSNEVCECEGARRGRFCELRVKPLNETCPSLARRAVQGVRADDVRLDEIGIIMAMGDSMTAGFNVKGRITGAMTEYRGWGFSSGVEPSATTIGTFLEAYNPQLVGGATGSRLASRESAALCPEADYAVCGLNSAVLGSRMGWMGQQADWLEARLGDVAGDTWRNQWKLLTILIGMGDIAFGPSDTKPQKLPADVNMVEEELEALLESLHQRFPKLLVNIVALPEGLVANSTVSTTSCKLFKEATKVAGFHWTDFNLWHDSIVSYNKMLVRVVKRWQAKTCSTSSCTMAVALRYSWYQTHIGTEETDSVDCFHPNRRLAEAMAVGLWNEMLEGPPTSPIGVHWARPAGCVEPQQRFTIPDPEPALSREAVSILV